MNSNKYPHCIIGGADIGLRIYDIFTRNFSQDPSEMPENLMPIHTYFQEEQPDNSENIPAGPLKNSTDNFIHGAVLKSYNTQLLLGYSSEGLILP